MAKRRTHENGARTKMVCIRMTEDDYALRARQARELGLTISGLCERLVREGKVDTSALPAYRAMDPRIFAELRRIGNNVNQIAHATNSNLPVEVMFAWKSINELIGSLLTEELIAQKTNALRTRTTPNDSAPPQTRAEFQRSVQLHPARRRDDFP